MWSMGLRPMSHMSHSGPMFSLVLAMFLATALAVTVVAVVALPARRDGRGLLTAKGEAAIDSARARARARAAGRRTADTH